MVVRRGANAAKAEHQIAAGQAVAQRRQQARRVVAQILRPGQLQPTRGQQFDEFGQVFVLTFAREQFVTNDESANVHEEFDRE